MLIGIVGFAGSGKGTAGNVFVDNFSFVEESFAGPVKDATAAIFGWDREMLEGKTKISRFHRDRPDKFWAKELNDPKFTPRKAMQLVGTEACRMGIHEDIWLINFVKRYNDANKPNTVVTDCRFKNEIELIKKLGGKVIRVKRQPDPSWYQTILFHNKGHSDEDDIKNIDQLRIVGAIPHESETDWIGCQVDEILVNDGELVDFEQTVADYANTLMSNSPPTHLEV